MRSNSLISSTIISEEDPNEDNYEHFLSEEEFISRTEHYSNYINFINSHTKKVDCTQNKPDSFKLFSFLEKKHYVQGATIVNTEACKTFEKIEKESETSKNLVINDRLLKTVIISMVYF